MDTPHRHRREVAILFHRTFCHHGKETRPAERNQALYPPRFTCRSPDHPLLGLRMAPYLGNGVFIDVIRVRSDRSRVALKPT